MDAPDKLTVKVTFSSKDFMDAEAIPVLMKQKKRAGFIRTAVFCYIKGYTRTYETTVIADPQKAERNDKLDSKVSMLAKLNF